VPDIVGAAFVGGGVGVGVGVGSGVGAGVGAGVVEGVLAAAAVPEPPPPPPPQPVSAALVQASSTKVRYPERDRRALVICCVLYCPHAAHVRSSGELPFHQGHRTLIAPSHERLSMMPKRIALRVARQFGNPAIFE
jgi:hypothetical protein